MATRTGYGDALCARLKPELSSCINLARGGRSSGSFRAEGLWDDVLARLKENRNNDSQKFGQSIVLIQFGGSTWSVARPRRAPRRPEARPTLR